jgi:hypothetical protein
MINAGAETAVRRIDSVPLPDIELPARLTQVSEGR